MLLGLACVSASTGERSVAGSLVWEGGQSEEELCRGAGVDAEHTRHQDMAEGRS